MNLLIIYYACFVNLTYHILREWESGQNFINVVIEHSHKTSKLNVGAESEYQWLKFIRSHSLIFLIFRIKLHASSLNHFRVNTDIFSSPQKILSALFFICCKSFFLIKLCLQNHSLDRNRVGRYIVLSLK